MIQFKNDIKAMAVSYGDEMRGILKNLIIDAALPFDIDIFRSEVHYENNNGNPVYIVEVGFDESRAWRPSLYPQKYDGVNIGLLFDMGYHADNAVYGQWRGELYKSKTYRVGLHYIDNAIEIFNRNKPDGVIARRVNKSPLEVHP